MTVAFLRSLVGVRFRDFWVLKPHLLPWLRILIGYFLPIVSMRCHRHGRAVCMRPSEVQKVHILVPLSFLDVFFAFQSIDLVVV